VVLVPGGWSNGAMSLDWYAGKVSQATAMKRTHPLCYRDSRLCGLHGIGRRAMLCTGAGA